jgi:hypothetical protein
MTTLKDRVRTTRPEYVGIEAQAATIGDFIRFPRS